MSASKGFTLIELAIVIAIIGILAAVAIPRLANLTGNAEQAVAENFLTQMNTGIAVFIAETGAAPADFASFVAPNPGALAAPLTVAVPTQTDGTPYCAAPPAAAVMTCNAFTSGGTATYTLNAGGTVTATFAGF